MWTWLLKIDPNVVLAIVTTVGAWAYKKIAGEHARTVESVVDGAVKAILSEIAEHIPTNVPIELWLKGARVYVSDRIWTALAKVGITKSPALERIVKAAIEQSTAHLAERIAQERRAHNHAEPPSLPPPPVVKR